MKIIAKANTICSTWAELYQAMYVIVGSQIPTQIILSSPITVPSGVNIDCQGLVHLTGFGVGSTSLTVSSGSTISNLGGVSGEIGISGAAGTLSFSTLSGDSQVFYILDGASYGGGIIIPSGVFLTILIDASGPGFGSIQVDGNLILRFQNTSGGPVSNNWLSGTGNVGVLYGSSAGDMQALTNASFTGTASYFKTDIDAGITVAADITANRPTATQIGQRYFDTTLGIPIWWNGTNWVNASGATV